MIVTRQRTQKNCSSTVKPNITSFIELVLEDRMNREVMLKLHMGYFLLLKKTGQIGMNYLRTTLSSLVS